MKYKQMSHKYNWQYEWKFFPCIEDLIDKKYMWTIDICRESVKQGMMHQRQLDEKISVYAAKSFIEILPFNPRSGMIHRATLYDYCLSSRIVENRLEAVRFIENVIDKELIYEIEQYTGFWDNSNDKHFVRTFEMGLSCGQSNYYNIRKWSYDLR